MKNSEGEKSIEGELIGLDVGEKNIGVARINSYVKIAEPLNVIKAGPEAFKDVLTVAKEHDAVAVVVGLPRGLDGQETAQTLKIKQFASDLAKEIEIPLFLIDEAGTTKEAAKREASYPKSSIDSLAATVFLEDFVNSEDQSLMRC